MHSNLNPLTSANQQHASSETRNNHLNQNSPNSNNNPNGNGGNSNNNNNPGSNSNNSPSGNSNTPSNNNNSNSNNIRSSGNNSNTRMGNSKILEGAFGGNNSVSSGNNNGNFNNFSHEYLFFKCLQFWWWRILIWQIFRSTKSWCEQARRKSLTIKFKTGYFVLYLPLEQGSQTDIKRAANMVCAALLHLLLVWCGPYKCLILRLLSLILLWYCLYYHYFACTVKNNACTICIHFLTLIKRSWNLSNFFKISLNRPSHILPRTPRVWAERETFLRCRHQKIRRQQNLVQRL